MTPPSLRLLLRPALRGIALTTALGVVASLITAGLIVVVIDVLRSGLQDRVPWLVAMVLARAALTATMPVIQASVVAQIRGNAQSVLYRFLLDSRSAVTDRRRTGELLSIATTGIERIAGLGAVFLPLAFRGVLVAVIVGLYALTVDLWVGAVMLAALPLVAVALRGMEEAFRGAGDTLRKSQDELSAAFLDALQGLETLIVFGADRERSARLAAEAEGVRAATMEVLRVAQRSLIRVDFVYSLASVVAVVAVVIVRIGAGAIDSFQGLALLLLSVVAVSTLVDVVSFFYVGGLGLSAYRRLRSVWDIPAAGTPPPGSGRERGVVLDSVTYTYPDGLRPALAGVTLSVSPGESLALVGPTGAGKSTIADLVRGIRLPERGTVLVEGRPPEPGTGLVVYVGQASHIFEDTVEYNLRIARPEASPDDLERACAQARFLEVVERLPQGFETRLGQQGFGLSGGEAQRLALARAFLSDAPIVVLDEATSGLDLETESLVSDAVFDLIRERMALVIAHRVTTARRCDRVARIEAGAVVSVGPAAEMAAYLAAMRGSAS